MGLGLDSFRFQWAHFGTAGFVVTEIGLIETILGIIPRMGGPQRLTPLIGMAIVKNLIYIAQAPTGCKSSFLAEPCA